MQADLLPSDFACWRQSWDMPLADGLVQPTSVDDWQRLLNMLQSSSAWRLDWHGAAAVDDAHQLLADRLTVGVWLTLPTMVSLFPYSSDEVSLDLDVRTVDDAVEAAAVSGFLRAVGELTHCDVLLTYEVMPDEPVARYSHSDGAFFVLG